MCTMNTMNLTVSKYYASNTYVGIWMCAKVVWHSYLIHIRNHHTDTPLHIHKYSATEGDEFTQQAPGRSYTSLAFVHIIYLIIFPYTSYYLRAYKHIIPRVTK